MTSRFWKYFHDTLSWRLIDAPGPVAALARGLAHRLDMVRDDALFLRDQGFPQKCEPELVPVHGNARGLSRHYTEALEQFRQRVTNAYAWHMLGGKWEGLPQILRFYGFDIANIEGLRKYQSSRWAEFQVAPGSSGNIEELNAMLAGLETLVWLINEYKPARSLLARLYNEVYNITPLVWSHGNYSEHFYSLFSGVDAPVLGEGWKDEGLQLSFGHRIGIEVGKIDLGSPAFSGWQSMGIEARYTDAPVWSHFCYSDAFPPKHGFTIFQVLTVDWSERINTSHRWAGTWDSRHWAEPATWDRKLPKWSMERTEKARSELVYSSAAPGKEPFGAGLWGGLNAAYGVPVAVIVTSPPVWGATLYSGDTGRKEISILEQFAERLGVETAPVELTEPQASCTGVLGMAAGPLHNQTWSGKWDSRRWWNYGAYSSVPCLTEQPKEPTA